MTDLSIPVDGCRVNLRVGAIIRDSGNVLICRLPNQEHWFLPGGRIKVKETSTEALERELTEEIGRVWELNRPVVFSENFFKLEGEDFHEMCVYYEVKWHGEAVTEQMQLSEEEFRWLDISDLDTVNLQPKFLASVLKSPGKELIHSIHREGDPVNDSADSH